MRKICTSQNLINSVDIYGQKFEFSFKGQKTFTTSLGAVMTIIVFTVFMAYATYQGTTLFLKTDISTIANTYSQKIDYANPEIINFQDYGFDFALKVIPPMAPEYGKLIVDHRQITQDAGGERDFKVTNLDYEECGPHGLNYSDTDEIVMKSIDKYYCLTTQAKQMTKVGGSFYSLDFQEVRVLILACENSTESDVVCASEEVQQKFFLKSKLEFTFISKYFDQHDQNSSVKQTVNDLNFFYLDRDRFFLSRLYLVPTTTSTYHSVFPFTFPTKETYLQHLPLMTQYGDEDFFPGQKTLTYISIRLSDQKADVQQYVYTLMEYLSDVGGLFKAVYVMGRVLLHLFLAKMFYARIIGSLFQVSSGAPKEEGSVRNLLQSSASLLVGESPRKQPSKRRTAYVSKETLQKDIMNEILDRRGFDYSFREIFDGTFKCFSRCRGGRTRLTQEGRAKKDRLFQKGIQHVEGQFDVLSLFSMMQQVKILSHALLSPVQRFLMKFQRKQVLNSESSDTEEPFWEDFDLLHSQNPMLNFKFALKLNRHVKKFKPRHSTDGFDQQLIRQIFLKKEQEPPADKNGLQRGPTLMSNYKALFKGGTSKEGPKPQIKVKREKGLAPPEDSKEDQGLFEKSGRIHVGFQAPPRRKGKIKVHKKHPGISDTS